MNNNIISALKVERNRLEQDIKKVDKAIALFNGGTTSPAIRKTKGKRVKITDAVLTALSNGNLEVGQIQEQASKLTGKAISGSSLSNTLVTLKKRKAVKSISRGVYGLAK